MVFSFFPLRYEVTSAHEYGAVFNPYSYVLRVEWPIKTLLPHLKVRFLVELFVPNGLVSPQNVHVYNVKERYATLARNEG